MVRNARRWTPVDRSAVRELDADEARAIFGGEGPISGILALIDWIQGTPPTFPEPGEPNKAEW